MKILDIRISDAQNNEVTPQVWHMGDGYEWDAADSLTRIISNRPLRVRPNLRSFHLDPRTNATDLVSQSYVYTMGLLASERFVRVLDARPVQPHELYEADVVHHGRVLRYFWLHMIEELEPRIDFEHSRFVLTEPRTSERAVNPTGVEDLRSICRDLVDRGEGALTPDHIAFLAGTPTFDLFCLRLTSLVWFVSNTLAEELEARELTGFAIRSTRATFSFG